MKWLEIIEIRSVSSDRELLESQLQQLMHDMDKGTHMRAIKAYSRATIDTDVSIHLSHDSQTVEHSGSPLGICLASALKAFGLVNHTIWVEAKR